MRVLIIASNSLSKTQSNGKTVASFFKSQRITDIAQLYFGTNENPDLSICNNYYRITEIDVIKSILNFSFKTTNTHTSLLANLGQNKDGKIVSSLKKHNQTLSVFRDMLWSFNTWDSIELNDWIKAFKPNVIFSVLGMGTFAHRIVRKLSERYNIPYFCYFTDDYVINDTSTNLLQRIQYMSTCQSYKKTINKAAKCYVIGEDMRKDYTKLYKRPFGTLVNSIDFSKFKNLTTPVIDRSKEIIISFIGGIHLNRWKSIVQLGEIVQEINKEHDLNIRIHVFTVKKPEKEELVSFANAGIYYKGALKYQGVLSQIEKSHFLLHVESFDKKNRLYTKYSVSTKIPEYLASKRGIIAYGPNEIASIKIFSKHNFGCCLTDLDSKSMIKSKLLNTIDNYASTDFIRAYNYAYANFNQDSVSKSLIDDLLEATKV